MQGITANSVGATSELSVSPLAIKTYYGFEAQPVWNGPWNGLSKVAPKPNIMAMQALLDSFYEMPDAMPMKYNSWGTFLPFLLDVLPKGIELVSSLFDKSKKSTKENVREVKNNKPKRTRKPRKEANNNKLQKELDELRRRFDNTKINNGKGQAKPRRTKRKRNNKRKEMPIGEYLKKMQ
jgi:hypothetical protein